MSTNAWMYLQIHSQTPIHADNTTLRFPYKCILICLQATFSCIHLNRFSQMHYKAHPFTHKCTHINSKAHSPMVFTNIHSHMNKLTQTNSYTLFMKMCLHMHSLKLAHKFTHKKSPICSQSHTCTFPQIQHNHKEHHTHMLTDEYAHTYHEVHTFTYTHRCSSIFTCTRLHINSQKYTPLSCAVTCIHSDTHEYFNIYAHGHKCTDP